VQDSCAEMVVACCRFLCYFCRTGRVNQRAMFEHLSYLLDNSCMLLCTCSQVFHRFVLFSAAAAAAVTTININYILFY